MNASTATVCSVWRRTLSDKDPAEPEPKDDQ